MIRRLAVPILLAALTLLSCDDGGGFFVGPATADACGAGGRFYTAAVRGGTWSRLASPHVLRDSVVVSGTLKIEAGALVCGMPGSSLTVEDLDAAGQPGAAILFAATGADGWGGLIADGTLRHARIQDAHTGVRGGVALEDVHIARTQRSGVAGPTQLRNVVIDSACAVESCAAFNAMSYWTSTLENVTIRDSGGHGIVAVSRCGLVLDDVTIEGSAGIGIAMPWQAAGSCQLGLEGPLRITGGSSIPALLNSSAAQAVINDTLGYTALTGNAGDTLVVESAGGLADDDLIVRKELALRIEYRRFTSRDTIGSITVQAGATLTANGYILYTDLRAEGTVAEPAIIRSGGIRIYARQRAVDTMRIRHAILHDVRIRADTEPVIVEDVHMSAASLDLLTAGSRIDGLHGVGSARRAAIVDADTTDPAAVTLANGTTMRHVLLENAVRDAVALTGAAAVSDCTITGSGRHGMLAIAGASTIGACNLHGNAGAGVSSESAAVDARGSWWGDAAGPLAPSGDGVAGVVLYVPFLTAPADVTCGALCEAAGRRR